MAAPPHEEQALGPLSPAGDVELGLCRPEQGEEGMCRRVLPCVHSGTFPMRGAGVGTKRSKGDGGQGRASGPSPTALLASTERH